MVPLTRTYLHSVKPKVRPPEFGGLFPRHSLGRNSSGSFAKFAAIRRASHISLVAAEPHNCMAQTGDALSAKLRMPWRPNFGRLTVRLSVS